MQRPKEANDVLRIKHITPKVLGLGFDKATIAAEAELSKGERLLFDVMHGVTSFKVYEFITSPFGVNGANLRAIIMGGAARVVFRDSVMGGVATLYQDALLLRAGDEEGESRNPKMNYAPLVKSYCPWDMYGEPSVWTNLHLPKDRVGEQDGKLHAQNIPKNWYLLLILWRRLMTEGTCVRRYLYATKIERMGRPKERFIKPFGFCQK